MTYNFILRKDAKNKDGLHPIRLRITKDRKVSYITLNIFTSDKHWDENQERLLVMRKLRSSKAKEDNDKRKVDNKLIESFENRVLAVLKDFDEAGIHWTLNQFKDSFFSKPRQSKIHSFLLNHAKNLKETNHIGNAICYDRLLHLMSLFDSNLESKVFGEIDIKYVNRFNIWLEKRGCNGNTRLFYMKTLRSIWNKALQEKEASQEVYPFAKGGFAVNSLAEETPKRYLPSEYLKKLKTTNSERPVRDFARRLFLLSYYTYGMSFIVMGMLEKKNIVKLEKGDYIVYKRQKTKNQKNSKAISIKVTPEIELLIKELTNYQNPIDNYLLPIVSIKKNNAADLYDHITNRRKRIVKHLKALAEEFNFEFNLTTYVSRHTMAMQLQNNEVSESVISQVLGHKDLKTTKTYLDSLDTSVIDAAGEIL